MPSSHTGLTVGEVARLAGITVRTLHHYDETGLLEPRGRSDAGYRLYDGDDIARLQRILHYRELGFGLDDITSLLDDPDVDALDHLRQQHELLTQRIARLDEMRANVQRTIDARTNGVTMTADEMLDVFGHDHSELQAEAEQRWGDTDAWHESQRRTSRYGKQDWEAVKAEQQASFAAFAEVLRAGRPPDCPEAMDAAERARQLIDERFYACPHELHRQLGDTYVSDPRFTATYDDIEPGLAAFVRDAIHANADRAAS